MQKDAAFQLGIKGAQAQRTFGRLTTVGKCLGQQIIQALAAHCTFGQCFGLFLDAFVRKRFEFGFQRIDLVHQGADSFDFAVVCGAKHLFGNRSETQHIISGGATAPV